VRIASLTDVENIIQNALAHPEDFDGEVSEVPNDDLRDPELDLNCTC